MPNMNTMVTMVLALVFVILLVNSGVRGDSPGIADLVGSITKINRPPEDAAGTGQGGTLLVEGVLADGTRTEVLVTVGRQSQVIRKTSHGSQGISFKELAEGQKVEVKFDGPMLMSYPLQGRAATITILP